MSDWSNWSDVDATGSSYRYRYVLRPALNGGKSCKDLLQLKKGITLQFKANRGIEQKKW
jgi:hypothetical protein